MQALRQMGGGVLIAVISLLLVIGGISLSLTETNPPTQPSPTQAPPIFATSLDFPTATLFIINTNTPEAPTQTSVVLPTAMAESATVPVICNAPAGWLQIIVNANDTLYTIAERYKTTPEILNASNCLNNTFPAAGSPIYVPPVPTVTVIPCGAPFGWVKAYSVQPGDNLYRISLLYRTTVQQVQTANCMGGSITIYTGQLLWVPNVPTSTPGITVVPSFPTATPSLTPAPPTATFIVTDSPVPTITSAPTNTNIPAATATPSITPFPTQ